jgi:hypothetical protein
VIKAAMVAVVATLTEFLAGVREKVIFLNNAILIPLRKEIAVRIISKLTNADKITLFTSLLTTVLLPKK